MSAFANVPSSNGTLGTRELAAAHEETRPLVRKGVHEDDWSAFEGRIRAVAVQFARDGVAFDAWYSVLRAIHDSVGAKLVRAFASDPRRLEAARHAMRRLLDQALSVIAAEFIDARERLLRAGAALENELSAKEARARLAREMHDEMGQQLTALNLDLGWLVRRHDTHDRDGVAARLHAMTALVGDTLMSMRRIATRLRLPDLLDERGLDERGLDERGLDERGLIHAVTSMAREVELRSGLHVHLSFPNGQDFRAPVELATAIFGAFQEILTNIVRHATAKNVHVRLARTDGALSLEIEDDGRGITVAEATGGSLGLLGVRERIALVHGGVDVHGERVRGTRVRITVPFEPRTAG